MIRATNVNEARKMIAKSGEKPVVVLARDLEFNRKVLEAGGFDVLLSVENSGKKDKPKYLDSGLNHVMARIASKNGVAIGIDVGEISGLESKRKAQRLARIGQNLKVCRKAGCKVALVNYRDGLGARDLLISLGALTKQAREAVD